jgi:CheY-like chemotaxis protein
MHHTRPRTDPPAMPEEPAPRPLRVLVADDEAGLRLAISLFLRRRGHHVVEAADAHEARRLATELAFDAALVDARMPGDGLRLFDELDASPALRGRTALMTGDPGRAHDASALARGRPYLSKPFDMHAAVALIERLGQ